MSTPAQRQVYAATYSAGFIAGVTWLWHYIAEHGEPPSVVRVLAAVKDAEKVVGDAVQRTAEGKHVDAAAFAAQVAELPIEEMERVAAMMRRDRMYRRRNGE